MPRILIIIALLAAAVAPTSAAQMRGRTAIATRGPGFRHFRTGGYGYQGFYADYGAESPEPPAAPPMAVERKVIQPERPTEPLLIEWQGDRFVRYGGAPAGTQSPDYAEATKGGTASVISHELPPAVLVYRDGHHEAVSDYVIARGVLYARGDYSRDGSWIRNIQLAALDLSATLKINHDSGVKFVLPAGPNEVVTRP